MHTDDNILIQYQDRREDKPMKDITLRHSYTDSFFMQLGVHTVHNSHISEANEGQYDNHSCGEYPDNCGYTNDNMTDYSI